ncbi:MAG: glycoside hydrolase, partial [Acidobacteriota bacterium]|nr:glycoside hydrolase [Acidobacteriota bacterium]
QVVAEADPQLINPLTDALPPQTVAASLNLPKDAEFAGPLDADIVWIHRQTSDADIYFVANRRDGAQDISARFRVAGKEAELWHPDTGKTEPAGYRSENGRTVVPLDLDPNDALFVVFRRAARASSRTVPHPEETAVATVEGPWEVGFQPGRGAPASVTLEQLASWSNNSDAGVKYFSGTATYTKNLDAPAQWFQPGARILLDLGGVKNLAEVSVNGKDLGILWKPPFRADVTGALKPGANALQIKVTNLWVNRLIGDQQPGVTQKYAYTPMRFYRANARLLPSGLLGPVRVVRSAP